MFERSTISQSTFFISFIIYGTSYIVYLGLIKQPELDLKLRKESRILKKYFETDEGILTLLNFYFLSETAEFDEPAGILDPNSMTFEFFPPDKKKIEMYYGFLSNNEKIITELILDLEKNIRINELLGEYENLETNKFLLKKLKTYSNSQGINAQIGILLKYYLSSMREIEKDKKKGLVLHAHPQKSRVIEDDEGVEQNYFTKKGYSLSDLIYSENKALGLIEYNHKVILLNDEPTLFVNLDVFYRMGLNQIKIGRYAFNIKRVEPEISAL